jgi:excinuclease ABC subunit A
MEMIRVRGARQHNLKDIDVDIPRLKLVVICGPSGSGKSTLAFDTLFAEGQRRFIESLSAYARQFLEQMDRPDVDYIEGLSPAIAIEQKSISRNPRSTVGTVTEIYDYLRLLFARVGRPHCPRCDRPIRAQTVPEIVDALMALPEGTRLMLLAPVVEGRKGEHKALLKELQKQGFVRAIIDGKLVELAEEVSLEKRLAHDIDVVIDRIVVKEKAAQRLADSVETALGVGQGLMKARLVASGKGGGENGQGNNNGDRLFSQKQACPHCGVSVPELTPQMFSFNSPRGACPTCTGLGTVSYFDPELIVPDDGLSIREGAIRPWEGRHGVHFQQFLDAVATHLGIDIYQPWRELPEEAREKLIYGSPEPVTFFEDRGGRRHFLRKPFEGVVGELARRLSDADSAAQREEAERFVNRRPCPDCHGARLKPEALAVRVGGLRITDLTRVSVREAAGIVAALEIEPTEREIADRILREVGDRLRFLSDVGLDYLSLERGGASLSGGEAQRIRLATQIGSRLVGVLYVLDEPTIGLHQRDVARLLATLQSLKEAGNSVIVVEHDPQTILSADHIVDMGPGAGDRGGEVIFSGTPAELLASQTSLTGAYLSGRLSVARPQHPRRPRGWLTLLGASEHNLKGLDVRFPLGCLTCVTGVSGSGKSTLVIDTLYRALARKLQGARERVGRHAGIETDEALDRVIDVDQGPIGRTPRSNPATYTGLFAPLRTLLARTPEARARGYGAERFSFNIKGGRCERCKGEGQIKIEMQFLPDVYVTCQECGGTRFGRETLEVRYKGKNVAEILDLTVDQAQGFFGNVPKLSAKLATLHAVGLGYVRLGQPSSTLSGGEAQRIKLARELSRRGPGRTVYILDEPTTGLHFADVERLLEVLGTLADAGNTVIVIEHNLDVIRTADHVIDLGPEGGEGGGYVVAEGTPEVIAACPESYTGRFLVGQGPRPDTAPR